MSGSFQDTLFCLKKMPEWLDYIVLTLRLIKPKLISSPTIIVIGNCNFSYTECFVNINSFFLDKDYNLQTEN